MAKSRIVIIAAGIFIILVFALIFIFGSQGGDPIQRKVSLTFWGVLDRSEVISSITALAGKNYQIEYREFNLENYESQLINALATGRGPDIFMLHSSWLPKHFDKLSPISSKLLGLAQFRNLYPTVVEQDFAPDGFIYALPLYIDTLALLYNQDIFDSKAVVAPPKNWLEFQNLVPKLKEVDSTGRLIKAAGAIGGSNKNINRATDLLAVLMIQSGVPMVTKDFSRADFSPEGETALSFFTQFANPASPYYTWSDSSLNAIDSFASEDTAMIFNYAHQLPVIQEKNPFLRVRITQLPQPSEGCGGDPSRRCDYANYWGVAVSNRTSDYESAWNFILKVATDPQIARAYAEATNRLPALRSLIAERINDPIWDVFARQALSARSWPQADNNAVDQVFSKMIDDVINGRTTVSRALKEAEDAVTALMTKRASSF